MTNSLLMAVLLAILSACSAEPATNAKPDSDTDTAANDIQDDVKTRQISIEEAAEKATKIIEADAKTEIDSFGEPSNGL
jgi:ABC-type transporter MlaC component